MGGMRRADPSVIYEGSMEVGSTNRQLTFDCGAVGMQGLKRTLPQCNDLATNTPEGCFAPAAACVSNGGSCVTGLAC